MKWECLAIILGTPLKEEWVSICRILMVLLSVMSPINLTNVFLFSLDR